jgi:hypothetical protein
VIEQQIAGLEMPVRGGRWTNYGKSCRVSNVLPDGKWNKACWEQDRQHALIPWSSDSRRSYRPTERGERMCSKEECK